MSNKGIIKYLHLIIDDEDENRPKCNARTTLAEWVIVPVEEIPDHLTGCKRCHGTVQQPLDENGLSLEWRLRHGKPEDFGLEPYPKVVEY